MLSSIPFPIVIEDIVTTGSTVVDFLGLLAIRFYDFVESLGSSTGNLSSIGFDTLTSS